MQPSRFRLSCSQRGKCSSKYHRQGDRHAEQAGVERSLFQRTFTGEQCAHAELTDAEDDEKRHSQSQPRLAEGIETDRQSKIARMENRKAGTRMRQSLRNRRLINHPASPISKVTSTQASIISRKAFGSMCARVSAGVPMRSVRWAIKEEGNS